MIITFEGIDRSGKSTMMDNLTRSYKVFKDVKTLRFPSVDNSYGKEIRRRIDEDDLNDPEELSDLFRLDADIQFRNLDYKKYDDIIFTDRSYISGIIYNNNITEDGIPYGFSKYHESIFDDMSEYEPDLIVLMVMSYNEIVERYGQGNLDALEDIPIEYLIARQNNYIRYLNNSNKNFFIYNSTMNELQIIDEILHLKNKIDGDRGFRRG